MLLIAEPAFQSLALVFNRSTSIAFMIELKTVLLLKECFAFSLQQNTNKATHNSLLLRGKLNGMFSLCANNGSHNEACSRNPCCTVFLLKSTVLWKHATSFTSLTNISYMPGPLYVFYIFAYLVPRTKPELTLITSN